MSDPKNNRFGLYLKPQIPYYMPPPTFAEVMEERRKRARRTMIGRRLRRQNGYCPIDHMIGSKSAAAILGT